MSVRVVLYAEGDLGGEIRSLPPPGEVLSEEHLGPAHALLRRCIVRERPSVPEGAILVLVPLRLGPRRARGSDLLVQGSLRRLLTWPAPARRPDLAVVLVDCDGHHDREGRLNSFVEGVTVPPAIGVPVHVEGMDPRAAKELLAGWVGAREDSSGVRVTLARTCRLEALDQLTAFQSFRRALAALLP